MAGDLQPLRSVSGLSSLLISVEEEATRRNDEVILAALTGACEFSQAARRTRELDRLISEWQQNCSKHHCYAAGDYWGNVRDYNDHRSERDRLCRLLDTELVPCGFCADCKGRMEENTVKVKKTDLPYAHTKVHKIDSVEKFSYQSVEQHRKKLFPALANDPDPGDCR